MMEKFHYTSRAGDEITLPWFNNLPWGPVEDSRKLPPEDQMSALLKDILEDQPETLKMVRRIELSELTEFFEAWQGNDKDVSLGESTPS